jgi:uncharacterized membrane protein
LPAFYAWTCSSGNIIGYKLVLVGLGLQLLLVVVVMMGMVLVTVMILLFDNHHSIATGMTFQMGDRASR